MDWKWNFKWNTGAFDPNLAGPGTHNITYTIDGACGDVNSLDVTAVQETESSITAPESICENVTPIDLQGILELEFGKEMD